MSVDTHGLSRKEHLLAKMEARESFNAVEWDWALGVLTWAELHEAHRLDPTMAGMFCTPPPADEDR